MNSDYVDRAMTGPTPESMSRLAAELASLHLECGRPSYREIEKAAPVRNPLPRSTTGDVFTGKRVPPLPTLLSLVNALHEIAQQKGKTVSEERFSVALWSARWERAWRPQAALSSYDSVDLASGHARAILDVASVPGFFVVDDAICLANWPQPVDNVICRTIDSAIDKSGYLPIEQPTRARLEQAIATCARDPEVAAYLQRQLPEVADHDSHNYKLSVASLLRGKPGDAIPPQILVEPQLWWVERTFNRQLNKRHSAERDLAGRLVGALLDRDNDAGDYRFRFPSDLYVEVAVIDESDRILVLSKDPRAGSNEAQSGRRWTCSIERGVEVEDTVAGQVDIKEVALKGIEKELTLDRADVVDIEFGAIALQSRNLNCSVVGVARIGTSVARIAEAANARGLGYFTAGRSATPPEATDMINNPAGEFAQDNWHATARLRMFMALRQIRSKRPPGE
ncbi:hypothetical protein [Nocardia brasiliensis]|uniref:hypothetical protein n=1 Tax=Nocardia brasiliensis TaxID=37326 RepID=UPI003D947AF3